MPEFTCEATLLVTAEDENDAYSQISDSGIAPGSLIGTVLITSLDPVVQEPENHS